MFNVFVVSVPSAQDCTNGEVANCLHTSTNMVIEQNSVSTPQGSLSREVIGTQQIRPVQQRVKELGMCIYKLKLSRRWC